MEIPKDLRYTNTHEWVRVQKDIATVGITDFAQCQLSDVTYVELPAEGDEVVSEEQVAVIESVKAASDIYAPISGKITAANKALLDKPGMINHDPYNEGWIFKIKITDPSELDNLLGPEEYEELAPTE